MPRGPLKKTRAAADTVVVEIALESVLAPQTRGAVLAHYEHVADTLALDFPHVPVCPVYYPNGLGEKPQYTAAWHKELPATIPFVDVGPADERKRYAAVDADALLWLVHRGAVGFDSWTPSPRDPERIGYARILLSPRAGATQEQLAEALQALRTVLTARGAQAVPVLDGRHGAALFLPFADLPAYADVRHWLHGVADAAVAERPALLATEPKPSAARIHLAVSSNAVGRYSSLPYTLAGTPELGMVTPIGWDELGRVHNGTYTAANSAERLAQGDRFAQGAVAIGNQRFAGVRA